jgi:hypothetical protein
VFTTAVYDLAIRTAPAATINRCASMCPASCPRSVCRLLDAPAEIATRFAAEYSVNQNPRLQGMTAKVNGKSAKLAELPARASVAFEVELAPGSAERFAYYDRAEDRVSTPRERLDVAWYSDIGDFEQSVTVPADGRSVNAWRAPKGAASGTLWIVLRDSRGGTDFMRLPVVVTR